MEQFNRDTYKQETLLEEFSNSCLGRIIILAAIAFILFIVAVSTVPDDEVVSNEAIDNVHECLQDNFNNRADEVDELFNNIARTFSMADTTLTNKDVYKAFKKYNTLTVYSHSGYKTAYLHNAFHPEGVRIAIGIFGMVISTINYEDMVLDLGPARGKFNQKLIKEPDIPELELGENPALQPFHYNGNPDD